MKMVYTIVKHPDSDKYGEYYNEYDQHYDDFIVEGELIDESNKDSIKIHPNKKIVFNIGGIPKVLSEPIYTLFQEKCITVKKIYEKKEDAIKKLKKKLINDRKDIINEIVSEYKYEIEEIENITVGD